MIKNVPTCSYCQIPHGDNATICPDCTELLRALLRQIPMLLVELETSLTRQSRIGRQDGMPRGAGERPLPFSPEASEATDVLLAHTITRWALDVWRVFESPLTSKPPTDPTQFLLDRVDAIKKRPWAGALLDEVQAAVDNAWGVVDLAGEYMEAGTCSCGTRLAACPDQPTLTCRGCGEVYDVFERREAMVTEVEEKLLPAKQIERLVDILLRIGAAERIRKRVPSGTVRGWASKGEIEVRGFDADGRTPTYRVGEVFDRAFREVAKVAA